MDRNRKTALRAEFVEEIRSRLIGPGTPDELLTEKPHKRYLTGMIFPRGASAGAATADEQELSDEITTDPDDPVVESPMDLLFQRLPASVGITFAIEENEHEITVHITAARYVASGAEVVAVETGADQAHPGFGRGARAWKRRPLGKDGECEIIRFRNVGQGRWQEPAFEGAASVQLYVRRAQGARIATVSMVNRAETDENKPVDVEDILFQVGMRCETGLGIPAYPDPAVISEDREAEELALQYRGLPAFAVGHGCGVDWPDPVNGSVASVAVDFMPAVEVPPVTTDIPSLPPKVRQATSMVRLQDEDFDPLPAFRAFVDEYEGWRDRIDSIDVPARFDEPKARILARIDTAIGRLRDGVELLSRDRDAMAVFRLMNRAMLLGIGRVAAARALNPGAPFEDVRPEALDPESFCWRPFQLAFLLLSLRGLWDPEHPDRSVVDLIWFPTGGGKTEAYLGVAAFEMIRRRFREGKRGFGTAVVKRYTLRLLTIQQFERAGSLICSLETLRRAGAIPGDEPFSLGLWVGQDSSPNTQRQALADLESVLAAVGRVEGAKIPLKKCPVCGTPIVPAYKVEGDDGVGLRNVHGRIEVFCPDTTCAFHGGLPISFIDDHLYAHPPTMLLGTVDKFALLAWRDEARAFFGVGRDVAPPSLIIQDELHLISGPLGTLAGIYEAAIDTAIARLGRRAKYIAATATIRRADEQIRRLYGRDSALFPPPGPDAADSFFSRVSTEEPGRLYIGTMGQGHTPTFSNVITASALLAAGGVMRDRIRDLADPWWTLIAYHNSKRELGKTLSLARDDIPARLQAIGERRRIPGSGVRELSANLRDSEIPEALHQLSVSLPDTGTLDFVACTNMLSVGVDVQRLGLMMMNGQPKTVSEYIQASSRVGRGRDTLPGCVLALFSPSKPRDRSHYEFFRAFHKAFYRFVEPTSVTPFAIPAQARGLHGAFLALVRMVSSIHANTHASRISAHESEIRQLEAEFLARVADARDGNIEESRTQLAEFLDFWRAQARKKGANLRFQSGGAQHASLIRPFRKTGDGRETLQSLRHVDTPLKLFVPVIQAGQE